MTAPNTPTPEEQARIDAKSVSDEFRDEVRKIILSKRWPSYVWRW